MEAYGISLADIVDNPLPKLSCVGVILDATGAYKTYDSIDYVTKLKIIDHSFNYRDNETNYKSFIHVFIYSDSFEAGPRTNRVGDIIKLTNFDFRTYQNSEVKALFHRGQSDWAVFDGRKNANFIPVTKSKQSAVSLTGNEKEEIKSLRNWAEVFFAENSSRHGPYPSKKYELVREGRDSRTQRRSSAGSQRRGPRGQAALRRDLPNRWETLPQARLRRRREKPLLR